MTARKRKRWPYLVGAAALLAVGAWLTSGGEAPRARWRPDVKMPRYASVEESKRAEKRRTLPVDPALPLAVPDAPARPRDPVFAAMPPDVKKVALVVEANALRNSDLGDAMIACMMAGSPNGLGTLRDAGFDPLTQLDRVSVMDDTLMLTGDFSQLKLGSPDDERYGEALIHHTKRGERDVTWAVWKDQVTLLGDDPEELKRAIDRLEGRGSTEPPVLKDSMAYGEMYGVLKPESLAKLFEDTDPRLAQLVRGAAQSVELHVDAMHDVGMVADVKGTDAQQVDELRRMLGGAIAAARSKAAAEGKNDAADVLDLSRVLAPNSGGTSFTFELGLPYEMLKKQLDKCVETGNRRRADRERERAREATVVEPDAGR